MSEAHFKSKRLGKLSKREARVHRKQLSHLGREHRLGLGLGEVQVLRCAMGRKRTTPAASGSWDSESPSLHASVPTLLSPTSTSVSVPLPEGLAVRVCVLEAHLLELTAPVQLIVAGVGLFPQILHVHPDQHLPEFHEITVVFVLHCRRKGAGRSAVQ